MALILYKNFTSPIRCISFDLDDTLYSNDEIIKQAELDQYQFICKQIPAVEENGIKPWLNLKWQVLNDNPSLKHDVTKWRLATIKTGLQSYIFDQLKLNDIAKRAFEVFYTTRSNFEIEPKVRTVLSKLSKQYPLIAVTNGNADIDRLELSQYFVGYYRAGENGNRMKPFPDMLNMAAEQMDIPVSSILHIGDNIQSDVKSALNANSSCLWFNPEQKNHEKLTTLPTGEYSDLDDLLQLL